MFSEEKNTIHKSSHPEVLRKKDFFTNFPKFTGKPATLVKKRLLHRCFPVNIAKFLKTLYRAPPDYFFWVRYLDGMISRTIKTRKNLPKLLI